MRVAIDFEYDTTQSEKSKKVYYALSCVELTEGEADSAPTIRLTFDLLTHHQIDALFDHVRFQVECANESGEDPYDATVELDDKTIIFTGNVSNVLRHIQGTMLDESHTAAIEEAPEFENILEKGKRWYVGASGLLETDSPNLGSDKKELKSASGDSRFSSLFGNRSSGTKRDHGEAFGEIRKFDCIIICK